MILMYPRNAEMSFSFEPFHLIIGLSAVRGGLHFMNVQSSSYILEEIFCEFLAVLYLCSGQ